jgi:hypothetical protein
MTRSYGFFAQCFLFAFIMYFSQLRLAGDDIRAAGVLLSPGYVSPSSQPGVRVESRLHVRRDQRHVPTSPGIPAGDYPTHAGDHPTLTL